jgi:mannosyltransferase OCH1-like enzyme
MSKVVGNNYIPGASVKAWRDFFTHANIFAVDIDESVLFSEDRIKTFKVDQSSHKSINEFINNVNVKFDVIIDDGSHFIDHQIISAYELSQHLNEGGIYIIEDVHTKYLDSYDDIEFPGLTKIYMHVGWKDKWDNFVAYKKIKTDIPKILHMVWVGKKNPPQYFIDNLNKWKSLMPNWQYMIWTNDKLTEEYFDKDYLELMNQIENPSQVSDFIRFYVLNKWGGYYLDADVTPIKNLEELPAIKGVILCNDLPKEVHNPNYMMCAFMAGVPNHPLWQECVNECKKIDLSIPYGVNTTPTGPAVLGYVTHQVINWEMVGGYTNLPYWYFYRNRIGDPGPFMPNRIMSDHLDAFGHHFYAASWI